MKGLWKYSIYSKQASFLFHLIWIRKSYRGQKSDDSSIGRNIFNGSTSNKCRQFNVFRKLHSIQRRLKNKRISHICVALNTSDSFIPGWDFCWINITRLFPLSWNSGQIAQSLLQIIMSRWPGRKQKTASIWILHYILMLRCFFSSDVCSYSFFFRMLCWWEWPLLHYFESHFLIVQKGNQFGSKSEFICEGLKIRYCLY